MKFFSLAKNPFSIFVHDILWVPIAWLGAYWLRFNLDVIPETYLLNALLFLPVVMVAQGVMFWLFGLYRGIWRFASMPDLMRIIKAVVSGAFLSLVVIFLMTRGQEIPRSVFPLYALILLVLTSGPRFVYRWLKDHETYNRKGQRVLVVGAGSAGEMLVRDLRRDPSHTYYPVALVDDDRKKRGKEIHGVRVMGTTRAIPNLVVEHTIDIVLIATPSANSRQMRRIIGYIEKARAPSRILPKMQDLMSGQVSIRELKEVSIEDLLGREQAELDWPKIKEELSGKVILITGGGGSIGSELCRQIANLLPAKLIIFEQSEHNLYLIEMELKEKYPHLKLSCVLGDSRDLILLDSLFGQYKPQIVFHAAAYKHVPMLENQTRTAVINNVLNTKAVADTADRFGCSIFVLVSTDKAVNPSNVMGATKRVAEIYCQTLAATSNTHFITVRFGNVLDSAGSVIPLFRRQITEGGPVTVTHRDITRYFMTIPEASQLIMQAAVLGKGGEIFVLDMGEPIKIAYLAEQLILLSGKTPSVDIDIIYTGLRPGEKLYEELFHDEEQTVGTGHPQIMLADSRPVDADTILGYIKTMSDICATGNQEKLLELLVTLVPENTIDVVLASRRQSADNGAVIYDISDKRPGSS